MLCGELIALYIHPRMFQFGVHFSAESTEAIRIKCVAQEHKILMQPRIELTISASRNRVFTHTINMPPNYVDHVEERVHLDGIELYTIS